MNAIYISASCLFFPAARPLIKDVWLAPAWQPHSALLLARPDTYSVSGHHARSKKRCFSQQPSSQKDTLLIYPSLEETDRIW